jgi:hypothetical protein
VLELKRWLDIIRARDPGLFVKLQQWLTVKADGCFQETGQEHELVWLRRLEEQHRGCPELA